MGGARDLGGDPRLAHAGGADDRHERPAARRGTLPARPQPPQLTVAADQRRRRGGVELCGDLRRGRFEIQRWVLPQDRVMEAPELWPWLDADFLDQRRPGLPVRLKCLSLPSTAVEAKHPLRVQTLAQRVVGQQPVDLDDDLLVAAAARSASMASSQAVSRSSSSRWITAVANGASATSASGSP